MSLPPSPLPPESDSDIRYRLAAHLTWLLTAGKSGERGDFSDMSLDHHNFHGHTLEGANFMRAGLHAVEMIRCEAARADFTDADMTGAFLHRARLTGACFRGARLAGAELNHADLRDADFSGADLTGVDFHKAHTDGAVFTGAKLDGSRGLDPVAA